mgnify:CR=1 FL=1
MIERKYLMEDEWSDQVPQHPNRFSEPELPPDRKEKAAAKADDEAEMEQLLVSPLYFIF